MSLINQALRKAQQDRTPNRMKAPTESDMPTTSAPTANSGMKPGILVGLIVVVALLIGIIAGLSVVIFKDDAPVEQTATQPPQPAETPKELKPEPIAPVAQTPIPSIPEPEKEAAPITPSAPSVINELQAAREVAATKAAEEKRLAEEAEAKRKAIEAEKARIAAIPPSQEIIKWLSTARIGGVRLSESGNKVVLNDRAYSVGESVHLSLGLKVLLIQEKRVIFIDNNGKKYLKRI